jgi:UDP-2,3-diacylglucosamine hydrolase
MSDRAAYFVCDAHLGADPPEREADRERRLHEFLASLPGRASALYVIGDLFDFWFEYRTAIPARPFRTLATLRAVVQAGVPVTYLNGNHDFWLGSFLEREVGVRACYGALPLEIEGRRIWLHHGDGLVGGDLGYRLLKRALSSRINIALYRLLHPDLGIPLARLVSKLSRRSRGDRPLEPERLWREIALPRFAEGYDAVLIGHFHHVFERRETGREFFLLGDWITRFSYAVLERGAFRLETWPPAGAPPD